MGDLPAAGATPRGVPQAWFDRRVPSRRALPVRIAGEERYVAIEDAGRLRDALGTALPVGVPEVFTEPVADPLGDLVGRFARTHGPFQPAQPAARLGLGRSEERRVGNEWRSDVCSSDPPCRYASPARSAPSRSRTPVACAPPSAPPCRSECRRSSPSRSPIRWVTSSVASPAPTVPSNRPSPPRGWGWVDRKSVV